MALSGSIYTNVGSHWQLKMTWSATQSISGNYSDVTAKLHWIALDSYGAVYSSATKTCNITIHGDSANYSAADMAALSANQDKVIWSRTVRVNHNSDGTASFSLDGWFQAEVTLSGTYYGTINLTAKTFTLDTIPRASSLTSSASWTAGNNLAISISRASSSFTHTAKIYVNGTWIKDVTGIGTSTTATFSTSENTTIFQQLNTGATQDTKITLITYDGTTQIGSKDYTGTVTAPDASTVSMGNFNIGDNPTFSISSANSAFTHTVKWQFGSWSKTVTGQTTSGNFGFTSSDNQNMYAQIPNANSGYGSLTITTYYNNVQVRSPWTSGNVWAYVVNSNPTFSSSSISYKDTNTTTTGITGNDQYIVQNKSSLTVYVNTAAQAINGASFSKYTITVNGVSKDLTSTTGSVSIGAVNASNNTTLTVKAIDSRGNSTTVSMTITMVPYSSPVNSVTLTRQNGFDNTTTLMVSGSFSGINVGGTNKNTVSKVIYRYKESGATSFGSDVTMSLNPINGTTFSVANVTLNLDNTKSYDFEIVSTDKLSSSTTDKTVGTGKPILFIDTKKKSVGVGMFPNGSGTFEVGGSVTVNGDQTITGNLTVDSTLTVAKNGYYSTISFPAQTNDPAYIKHYENNNSSYMQFSVSDDKIDSDYFSFGSTPSGTYQEAMRLTSAGNMTVSGSITGAGVTSTGALNGATIELTNSSPYPYMDFKTSSSQDYIGRISLQSNVLRVDGVPFNGASGLQSYGRTVATALGSSTIFQAGVVAVPSNVTNTNQKFTITISAFPNSFDGVVCSIQDNYGVSYVMTCEAHPTGTGNNQIEFEINSSGGSYSGVHISWIAYGH